MFPVGTGLIDVTKPPYLAPNDGIGDATAASQKALDDYPDTNRLIRVSTQVNFTTHTAYLVDGLLKLLRTLSGLFRTFRKNESTEECNCSRI